MYASVMYVGLTRNVHVQCIRQYVYTYINEVLGKLHPMVGGCIDRHSHTVKAVKALLVTVERQHHTRPAMQ